MDYLNHYHKDDAIELLNLKINDCRFKLQYDMNYLARRFYENDLRESLAYLDKLTGE